MAWFVDSWFDLQLISSTIASSHGIRCTCHDGAQRSTTKSHKIPTTTWSFNTASATALMRQSMPSPTTRRKLDRGGTLGRSSYLCCPIRHSAPPRHARRCARIASAALGQISRLWKKPREQHIKSIDGKSQRYSTLRCVGCENYITEDAPCASFRQPGDSSDNITNRLPWVLQAGWFNVLYGL